MEASLRTALAVVSALAVVAVGVASAGATGEREPGGSVALAGRAVLPASTFRAGSAPSGAFFNASDRANARVNGLTVPETGAVFARQPIQGFSAVIPSGVPGEYFALSDSGYGVRGNSADWQLWVNRVRPAFSRGRAAPGKVEVTGGFGLSDPDHKVPWTIVCDPTTGVPLPPFDFNALPTGRPALCGEAADRILTGFDFDPESVQVAEDGTFWFGEEYGPFLLHTDREGHLLEAPVPVPDAKAPQNPTLRPSAGDRPTVNSSKGLEGLGISPDRKTLYPLLEGAVPGDDARDLRLYVFDIGSRRFRGYDRYRLELPSTVVDTAVLHLADGDLAYPADTPPSAAAAGENAIGELTVIDEHHALVLERDDGYGDFPKAPRFKRVFVVRLGDGSRKLLEKRPLIDLLAVPDPTGAGGEGRYFRFPFLTAESITAIDDTDLLIANDNNYPFSNGRSFSTGGRPGRGLAPDDDEFIDVRIEPGLGIDPRLLTAPTGR